MSNSVTYTICGKCGSVNRIHIDQTPKKDPICGKCKSELAIHDGISELNSSTLDALIGKSPLPSVVDFWAPWCGPCRAFAPTFKQAALSLSGKVVFAKVDTQANPQVGQKYEIKGIPTLAIFLKGKELNRISGALPYEDLIKWVNESL